MRFSLFLMNSVCPGVHINHKLRRPAETAAVLSQNTVGQNVSRMKGCRTERTTAVPEQNVFTAEIQRLFARKAWNVNCKLTGRAWAGAANLHNRTGCSYLKNKVESVFSTEIFRYHTYKNFLMIVYLIYVKT